MSAPNPKKPRQSVAKKQQKSTFQNKDDTIKITQIISERRIWCGINVTLSSVSSFKSKKGDKIFLFLFRNGQSLRSRTITGKAKNQLGFDLKDKLKVDENYRIQGEIYANPKDKRYESKSSSKFDLNLIKVDKLQKLSNNSPSTSNGSSASFTYGSGLNSLRDKLESGRKNFDQDLKGVFIESGSVYRYMGCETCFTSLRVPQNGKYFCSKCTKKAGDKKRQICMMIKNIKLRDKSGKEIENILSFDTVTKQLLKNNGNPFLCDFEAQTAFMQLIGAKVNAVISVKKSRKKGSQEVILSLKSIEIRSKVAYSPEDDEIFVDAPNDNPEEEILSLSEEIDTELVQSVGNMQISKNDDAYKLNSKPPGLVLLINNNNFPKRRGDKIRIGSETDVTNIKNTFNKLRYQIFKGGFTDVKSYDLYGIIVEFQEELILKKIDSSVVVIMSHGSHYNIEFVDGKKINLYEDVIYKFSGNNFHEFDNKPKMFIIQACQKFPTVEEFPRFLKVDDVLSDILVCFACLPGYAAHRFPNKGSIFITELCREILKSAHKFDIIRILKQVQIKLKVYASKQLKKSKRIHQLNWYMDLIFRTFYFGVPPALPFNS